MMAIAQLHKADGNDNSSLIMINQKSFVMSNLTELELLNADEIETLGDAKFLTNTQLSNIHVDLHLHIFAQEYATLMNYNVLSGEIKYK